VVGARFEEVFEKVTGHAAVPRDGQYAAVSVAGSGASSDPGV
jgi:hypothetical protein